MSRFPDMSLCKRFPLELDPRAALCAALSARFSSHNLERKSENFRNRETQRQRETDRERERERRRREREK